MMATVISMMSRQGPKRQDVVLPMSVVSLRACWRSEGKNQRSGGCQNSGNPSSPGVLPRAATARLFRQLGRAGRGWQPFYIEGRRSGRVREGGVVYRGEEGEGVV
jgi:hypothetical protein